MEAVNTCSPDYQVAPSFVDDRMGRARIAIHGLHSPLNLMRVGAILPDKFDDTSLFDLPQIYLRNVQGTDQRPMPAQTARSS
jgi:hypothetical protein